MVVCIRTLKKARVANVMIVWVSTLRCGDAYTIKKAALLDGLFDENL